MEFEFFIDKMPTTNQQKGITYRKGKLVTYNRNGTSNIELRKNLIKNKPKIKIEKNIPIQLEVEFHFKNKDNKKWGKYKTTRPDCDNLMKNLQDYMTEYNYYSDDSQIAVLNSKKYFAEKNSIKIRIKKL